MHLDLLHASTALQRPSHPGDHGVKRLFDLSTFLPFFENTQFSSQVEPKSPDVGAKREQREIKLDSLCNYSVSCFKRWRWVSALLLPLPLAFFILWAK